MNYRIVKLVLTIVSLLWMGSPAYADLKLEYDLAVKAFTTAQNTTDLAQKRVYLDEALKKFEAVVAADRNYGPALYHIGLIYYNRNEYAQALPPLQLVADQEDAQPETRIVCNFYIGMCYLKQEKFAEAIAPLKTALDFEPGNLYYAFHLAEAYNRNGNFAEAKPYYDRILANGSNRGLSFAAQAALRDQYFKVGDLDKAKTICDALALLDAKDRSNNNILAQILEKQQNWDGAIAAWTKVADADAENSAVYNRLGSLLMTRKKNYPEAIKYFQLAEAKKAANDQIYYSWGRALLEIKDLSGALTRFKKAYELNAANLDALIYMARTQLQGSDYLEAQATVNKAIELKAGGFAYATRGELRAKIYPLEKTPLAQIRTLKCAIEDFQKAMTEANLKDFATSYIVFCNSSIQSIVETNHVVDDLNSIKCLTP